MFLFLIISFLVLILSYYYTLISLYEKAKCVGITTNGFSGKWRIGIEYLMDLNLINKLYIILLMPAGKFNYA
ncbi:MAG: hypothetical protein ACQESP_12250 [Candidatus Muiribacteriota bacterium]